MVILEILELKSYDVDRSMVYILLYPLFYSASDFDTAGEVKSVGSRSARNEQSKRVSLIGK